SVVVPVVMSKVPPPAFSVTLRPEVTFASVCSVPPLKLSPPAAAPRLSLCEIASVPPLIAHDVTAVGQGPGAAAGLLEIAEAAVLRARPDLRDVEARIRAAAERQRPGAAAGHDDIAVDDRARAQLQPIDAAGERDGVGLRRRRSQPVDAARDRAAVDDS